MARYDNTAYGRLMLTVLGGPGRIRARANPPRTSEGRAPKANGHSLGRKPKLAPHQKSEAIKRRDRGESYGRHCPQLSRLTAVARGGFSRAREIYPDGGLAIAGWREPAGSDSLRPIGVSLRPAIPRRVAPQQNSLRFTGH